jgi:hypothetical protein
VKNNRDAKLEEARSNSEESSNKTLENPQPAAQQRDSNQATKCECPPGCVGLPCCNSARSMLAEAIMNHRGAPQFHGFSVGSHPTGTVNPAAIKLLPSARLSTEGLRSKSWDEFAKPRCAANGFHFHGVRRRRGRKLPAVAGPSDYRALGSSRSRRGTRNAARDRTSVSRRVFHAGKSVSEFAARFSGCHGDAGEMRRDRQSVTRSASRVQCSPFSAESGACR